MAESVSEHTRLQRIHRSLWRVFGPAQSGPPPYATAEERALYERSTQAPPADGPRESQAPAGYRYTNYTDSSGIEHRAVVRDTAGEDEPR